MTRIGRPPTSLAALIEQGTFDASVASHKRALAAAGEHGVPPPEALGVEDDEVGRELAELTRLFARYRRGGWRSEARSIAKLFQRTVERRAAVR
jgi:hypothetical protein